MDTENTNNFQLIELQYFPCINYIEMLLKTSNIEIEACETFQKMSFRNRTVVASANGLVSLTIPLKNGREQKELIRDVEVDDSQNWRRQHWRTVVSSYHKSPFFEYYAGKVEELIFTPQMHLFDLNFSILTWLCKVLKIETEIIMTMEFLKSYPAPAFDFRNYWLPKNFQEREKDKAIIYPQVFENKIGFQPNLSILDLLFNEGPNARHLLLQNGL